MPNFFDDIDDSQFVNKNDYFASLRQLQDDNYEDMLDINDEHDERYYTLETDIDNSYNALLRNIDVLTMILETADSSQYSIDLGTKNKLEVIRNIKHMLRSDWLE